MDELSTNKLMVAIMKVDPTAFLNYRLTTDCLSVEWAVYAEGKTPDMWFATCDESLRSYAKSLKDNLIEVDRVSDIGVEALTIALKV